MATPQEEAAEAAQARDRLEQAALVLFAAYVAQQQGQEEESGELPEVDLLRIRRLISEVIGWYYRQLARVPGIANHDLERDDELVDRLLPGMADQVKALRQWMRDASPRDPGELSLQRNASRALATTIFNTVGHTVAANTSLDDDVPPLRKVWITRKDKRVRKLHRLLHGRLKDVDEDFWRWPATGQRLRFPGDPMAPLDATINCRCVLVMTILTSEEVTAAFPPLPPEEEDE